MSDDVVKYFLNDLFNLLFWKDYYEGYLNWSERWKLSNLLDYYKEYRSGEDVWHDFDYQKRDEVYKIINEVRAKIGLTEDLPK